MNQARRIQAVLFDLGNTLLDFDCQNDEIAGMLEAGARRAYHFLKQQGYNLRSFSNFYHRQARYILWRTALSRLVRRDFNALHTLGHVTRGMGLKLSPEQLQELCWEWYAPLSNTATIEAELREVLEWLVASELKLGIISNTFVPGEILDRHLEREGLLDYFPVRIYSCGTRFRKPSRKIFQMALKLLSCRPEEVIFVGDVPRNDVRGARRMGMIAVLKNYRQRLGLRDRWMPFTKPDFTITHMRQLKGIIEQLQQSKSDQPGCCS